MSRCGYLCATAHVWKSKNSLPELALSFHHMGPRTWTQVFRFVGKLLYSLTPFTSPYLKRLFKTSFSMLTSACCVCCNQCCPALDFNQAPLVSPASLFQDTALHLVAMFSSSWLWRFPNLFFDSLEGFWGSFVVFYRHLFIISARYLVHGVPGVVGFEGGRPQWQSNVYLTLYYLSDSSPSSLLLLTLIESLRCCGLVSMMCNCLFLFCAVVFGERPCTVHT